jgi:hypothetical protein
MQVTILGAGGNMGRRIARSLRSNENYKLRLVEPSDRGRGLLAEMGLGVMELEPALAGAEVVVFAVPDVLIKEVSQDVVPHMDSGASMLFLDPAAVAADRVFRRSDVNCYVTHPTHPPLYSLVEEPEPEARLDFWGGGLARQAIVFAVGWGDDNYVARQVEELATVMFAPVTRSHRVTVAQMAVLEPALSEILVNGCISLIREGMEHVVGKGLPAEAVSDFLMGHLQIGIAIIFQKLDWKLSAGAQTALSKAHDVLFKNDWQRIFEPDFIMESVREITGG